MFRIALGAGHRLETSGKRCLKSLDPNETREWVLNDRICDKVEKLLAEYDDYKLLRVDDTEGKKEISVAARNKAANDFKADVAIAVHHNAGIKGGKGGGIVAYVCKGVDAETKAWQKDLYNALIAHTGLKGNRANPLGVANFLMLTGTKMPAVLLELGFMDSQTDVPVILTDDYATKCAKAIVEVIVKRGGLKKKGIKPATTGFESYKVRITCDVLNVRKGAGTAYPIVTQVKRNEVYTIVGETKGWGKLKSGAGYIKLSYTRKL